MEETSIETEESEVRKLEDGLWYIRMPLAELIRRQKEPISIPSPTTPPKTSNDPSGSL